MAQTDIHTVANEIVTEALIYDCDVILFEDPTDIRERLPQAEWHHAWAFRRLFEYVEYKTVEKSISVEQGEPNHTSQRCSRTDCGFTHDDNRHGEHFECQKCGYELNADYNGAKTSGYGTLESDKTDSVPRPRRGAETQK